MAQAPVDFAIVSFPGNQFRGEIVPALRRLVAADTIQIVDLLFVARTLDGDGVIVELADLDEADYEAWEPLVGTLTGYLSPDDALAVVEAIEPGSSAALIVYENSWAAELANTISGANGSLLFHERIPRAVIAELEAALAEA